VPPKDWRLRIQDIVDAISVIADYTAEHDLDSFREDQRTIDAVVYRFVVIGEAASAVPDEVRTRHPSIPWDQIRGMRNILVHEYAGIRVDTVWQTIRDELPLLVPALEEMLD
jgi:uncharacterized protein with HEPN domain